jgi:DNA-binding LacI/PurR family transcriptional regulator
MEEEPAVSRPRAPTIYDVAAAAGVAASTVSRAFARPGRVGPETAAHIRKVAEELGYRTNPLARALPSGKTSLLALVISDVTNPFYNEIIRGAETAATEAGYTILLADTQESLDLERKALERAVPMVEGIVLATSRMSDSGIRMFAKQRPMIALNRAVAEIPSVITDNPRGMRRAVEHLAQLGHRTITYVAGPNASWVDGIRWLALREAGLDLEIEIKRIGPYRPDVPGGTQAAVDLGPHPSGAVIAYNDLLAIGIIRKLATSGVHVPEDVSVVGFDNILASELITPALTTVDAPRRTQGITAVQHLIAVIAGARPRTGEPFVLPARLVVRASTGPSPDTNVHVGSGAPRSPRKRAKADTAGAN